MKFFKKAKIHIYEPSPEFDEIQIQEIAGDGAKTGKKGYFSHISLWGSIVILALLTLLGGWFFTASKDTHTLSYTTFSSADTTQLIAQTLDYQSRQPFLTWLKGEFIHINDWQYVESQLINIGWTAHLQPARTIIYLSEHDKNTPVGLLAILPSGEKVWIFPYRPEVRLEWQKIDIETLPFSRQITLSSDIISQITGGSPMELDWDVLLQVEHVLSWSKGLRELKKGDTITMAGREFVTLDGGHSRLQLDALKVTSSSGGGDYLLAFRRESDPAWVNEKGIPLERRFLSSPVTYGSISSRYNLSRLHPVLQKIRAHKGTDFAAPKGTPIRSIADGVVTKMEFKPNNGNYVEITHDESFRTMYLHMSEFPSRLSIGDEVSQGAIIGFVGSTGLSTGPHVCLRFWVRDRQEDFLSVIRNYPAPYRIPTEEWRAFIPFRDSLLTLLTSSEYSID